MTASTNLELSQTDCASGATQHQAREQQAATSQANKQQREPSGATRAVRGDDKAADQDQGERLAGKETRRGAKESVRTTIDSSRAETCCAPPETSEQLPADSETAPGGNVHDGQPQRQSTAQTRLPPADGGPSRQRRLSGESRAAAAAAAAAAVAPGHLPYSQFLYETQPHQPILPVSFQPFPVASPQHLFNYLEQQQQQQHQHMLQPQAPQAALYSQSLVSWAPQESGAMREPSQLYAPAVILQHQPPVCALPPGPYSQLQPAMVPGNFGPGPLVPIANYLPAPAFYTGHHHHHLYNQSQQKQLQALYQHQHLQQAGQQVVAHQQHSAPDKPNELGLSPCELAASSPSPGSVLSSGSDSDAAETSRVIVDAGEAANGACGRELGQHRENRVAPPQGSSGKSAAERRNERAAALMNDETSTTTTQSNRSTSQQRPAATMLITTTKPTPGGTLIRRDDIDVGGSKNGTRREQRRPHECESANGAKAGETRQEEQKKATAAALLGGEDRHAGARVKPFDSEVPSQQAQIQAIATATTNTDTNTNTSRLTAHCENPTPTNTESGRQQVAETIFSATNKTNKTTTIDETHSANVLMVATSGKSAPPQRNTIEDTGQIDCQPADIRGSSSRTPVGAQNGVESQPKVDSARTSNTLQDGDAPAPYAQTGQISINGTTFYHVNPALVRVGLPPQSFVQEQPVCTMYQAANKNLVSYHLAPAQQPAPYQFANEYAHNQMLTLPPNRLAADYYYYWPPPPPPAVTNARRFDLVQTTNLASSNQQQQQQQQQLYGAASYELDQRPFLTIHQQLAFPKPFHYEPSYSCLTQQAPFVAQTPAQVSHIPNQAPFVAPQPPSAAAVAVAAAVSGPPQVLTAAAVTSSVAPAQTSSSSGGGGGGGGISNGASQLKLGYNLIPLLPISAIPTRVRQAYGMDKVWQDEFEQLFSQFVSQVVWTLVEVETNPNIRSSSRLLAYKGRYIVRVDTPALPNRPDGSCSVASIANQDEHKQPETEPACDEDDTSSWTGAEDADTCCCPAEDSDGSPMNCAGGGVDSVGVGVGVSGGESRQGRSVVSNSGESDCDSGAVLNSTSGSSETTSQDLGELGSSQSPASLSPCSQASRDEPGGSSKAQIGRKFPLKFRMFIDSAKVRFCCDSCGHGWTSMKGRVVFWYELFELIDGAGTGDGVSNLIGYCAYKLFGQQCDVCKIENRFERPMWYPEEVTKVLCNFFNKIGQVYFGFRMPAIDKQRRAGKPKTSHNSLLCQACHDGVCTDRK